MNKDIRIFNPFEKVKPHHFFALQAVTFAYFIYRLASRDYRAYGFLDFSKWVYPREISMELLPYEASRLSTFHFIYEFIPTPNPGMIGIMQFFGIGTGFLGLMGIFPKMSAIVCCILGLHFGGFILATNGDIEGGSVMLSALIALAIAPKLAFYRIPFRNREIKSEVSHIYRWPVWLFIFLGGSYYSIAGWEKIIETGPHWPFVLHIEWLAERSVTNSLFYSSRYAHPGFTSLLLNPITSYPGGIMSLYAEFLCLSVLFWPRGRAFIIFSLISLHVIVFLTGGINFLGSIPLLLLFADINALFEPITVKLFHSQNGLFIVTILKKLDWFENLQFTTKDVDNAETLVGEGKFNFSNIRAWERIFVKIPLLYPLAAVSSVPGSRVLLSKLFK